jgi:hypothetical protein
MSNVSGEYPSVRTRVGRGLSLAFFAFAALVTPALGIAHDAHAQSSYGRASYGVEPYSAADGVDPPNTGFELAVRAASEQPLWFCGGASALAASLVAGTVVIRRKMKRKQEN